jgi:hypothetical protein
MSEVGEQGRGDEWPDLGPRRRGIVEEDRSQFGGSAWHPEAGHSNDSEEYRFPCLTHFL